MADHCPNCAALRERVEAAESRMASLGDVINQGLRECSSHQQATGLDDDLRPYVRRLVDAAREQGRFWERAAPSPTPEPTTPPAFDCVNCCCGEHECPEAGCDCCDGRCLCKCHRRESQQEPLSPHAREWRDAIDGRLPFLPVLKNRSKSILALRELLRLQDQQSREAERQRVLGVLDTRIAELNLYDNEDNEAAGGELYGYQWLQRHLSQPQQGGG